MRLRFLPAVLLLLAGCTPYAAPAHLTHTPGPPVVIADGIFRTIRFSVTVPQGWRAVTSPASLPPSVVLAGGDCELIVVGEGDLEAALPLACDRQNQQTAETERLGVPVRGTAPLADIDSFRGVFEAVAASVAEP